MSVRSPHSPEAMFLDGLKFRTQFFKKGPQRNIPVNFFRNRTSGFREKDFLRIAYKIRFRCHGNQIFLMESNSSGF